jgi:hypothetical protein
MKFSRKTKFIGYLDLQYYFFSFLFCSFRDRRLSDNP